MAVRIRKDGTIVCAAKSEAEKGDYYIDDTLQYILHSRLGALHVVGLDENGAELWGFREECPHIKIGGIDGCCP